MARRTAKKAAKAAYNKAASALGPLSHNPATRRQRNKKTREMEQSALLQTGKHTFFRQAIPEATCDHCAPSRNDNDGADDGFDENGYPLIKKNAFGSCANPLARVNPLHQAGLRKKMKLKKFVTPTALSDDPFRFLDLPAELRTYVYELAFSHEKQVVCVNDAILRPSADMPDPENVIRECKLDLIYVPCQLQDRLSPGIYALSAVCTQIHNETALIPYKVNTFSFHNLYYLQTFLTIIGPEARKAIRSLRFDWKLPEGGEATALGLHTNLRKTYALLLECEQLHTLWVDMDVENLLTWNEYGNAHEIRKQDLSQTSFIHRIYQLRELKEIRVRWKNVEGLVMEDWVKAVMGEWRDARGSDGMGAPPVEAECTLDSKREWWCIHWKRDQDE